MITLTKLDGSKVDIKIADIGCFQDNLSSTKVMSKSGEYEVQESTTQILDLIAEANV